MDTSTVEVAKQTLTRGGKRLRSMEEKRRIIEEVLRGEESVAAIARRYEVNANLVFQIPSRQRVDRMLGHTH